jgi:hypothetical protein
MTSKSAEPELFAKFLPAQPEFRLRANIRFRPGGKNKTEFVHTLNGSALAVGRLGGL